MDELEEAEQEHLPPHDIPLHPYFQQIRQVLKTTSITPSTAIRMKDCLYDLSSALTDCIIFLEKRKTKMNRNSSHGQEQEQEQGQGQKQGQGRYSLPELWFLCKTKRKLIRIKKKLLVATSHPVLEQSSLPAVTDVVATSSSGSLSYDGPRRVDVVHKAYADSFTDQAEKIENLFLGTSKLNEEGFSKEIGIVGIGGCGKTIVARMVFEDSDVDSRIWINLQAIRKAETDLKKILKAMLEQCNDGQRDLLDGSVEVEEEELLEALHKALRGKSYLLVFDGIWDINLDWYFKLKERLEWHNKSNQNRMIMITTRLDGVAKRTVGPNNLYRMQPFSNEDIWLLCNTDFEYELPDDYWLMRKMKDEIVYHCHGLLLSARTFFTILLNHSYGGDLRHVVELMQEGKLVFYVMMNPKDDANQGNDLLLSLRILFEESSLVSDISEVVPQLPLHDISKLFHSDDSEVLHKLRILVYGGDATTNRVLRALSDMELHPTPPIGVMPLGTQVHISISLGWLEFCNEGIDSRLS